MKFSFLKATKLFALTAGVVLIASALTGCGSTGKSDDNAGGGLSGDISVIGSTSVGPVMQGLSDAFTTKNPNVNIDIQEIGSTEGVKAATDKTADIGTSSRALKDEEKSAKLTETVIAYDGIAVVVSPVNKVKALTTEQIQKIFKGEIKNWKQLGGADKDITVITREDGSGTRGAFQELLKLEEKNADGTKKSLITTKALVNDSTGSLKTAVAGNDAAIGYISVGAVDDTVKALSVDGVAPSLETVKNKTYPVWRPYLILTNGEMKPEVKAFVDFILSADGQKIVTEDKLVTVSK